MTIVTRSPTLKDCNDRVIGESPRSRGLRRNFCRVFSMIPFEALTISSPAVVDVQHVELEDLARHAEPFREGRPRPASVDRKSTRLNSSHLVISYAVFCLKKK